MAAAKVLGMGEHLAGVLANPRARADGRLLRSQGELEACLLFIALLVFMSRGASCCKIDDANLSVGRATW